MGISPPNHQKDAVPTPQGWRHPRTNELLVSRTISQTDIDIYLGIMPAPPAEVTMPRASKPVTPIPTPSETMQAELEPVHGTLSDNAHEEDPDWHSGCDHEDMTKDELEAKGREHGIELDRRKSREDLVEELEDHIENDYQELDLESMTKRELEDLGREHGIELDRRQNKKSLIKELKEVL